MHLKQNSKLTFFITHGQNNSVPNLDVCGTCFRPYTLNCHVQHEEMGEKTEENKNIKFIISNFCDETSAHGFARCKKPQSQFKRTVWCVITAGVFIGIAVHLLSLAQNYVR